MGGHLELFVDRSARQGGEATAREIAQQPAVWREVSKMVASRREDVDAFFDRCWKARICGSF